MSVKPTRDFLVVQSFWTKPILTLRHDPGYADKPGNIAALDWPDSRFTLMSVCLSALQLLRSCHNVTLITDSTGKHIFSELLQIRYNTILTDLDDLDDYPADFWSLAKLYTYKTIGDRFIHLDYDMFVNGLPLDNFSDNRLVTLHSEQAPLNAMIYNEIRQIIKDAPSFPIDILSTGKSINTGVVGALNISLTDFAEESIEIMLKNRTAILAAMKQLHPKYFNRFFEQMLLYAYACNREIELEFLVDGINTRKDGLGAVYEFPEHRQFLHINHEYRRNQRVCEQLEQLFKLEFPEYYHRLINLFAWGEIS